MHTSKSSARGLMTAGGIMTGLSAAIVAMETLTGSMGPGDFADITPVLTVGIALFGAGVLQVGTWARRRREQFDRIAASLRDTIRS